MSTVILGECWPLQGLSAAQKLVLISLADQANDDGVCWPGVKSICRRTCLSERAVQEALQWLEAVGLVSKEYRANTSTSYTISTRHFDPTKAPPRRKRKRADTQGGAPGAPGAPYAPGAPSAPGGAPGAPGGAPGAPLGVRQAHPNHQLNHQGTISEPSLPVRHEVTTGATGGEGETAFQAACRGTWTAYVAAYQQRYGTAPVRNAKVNSLVKQLVQRLGREEAPHVAEWFVGNVNEAYVVRTLHDLGALVNRAEVYRTQWATGRTMTDTRARQMDRTQSNVSAADEAIALLRQRRSGNAY